MSTATERRETARQLLRERAGRWERRLADADVDASVDCSGPDAIVLRLSTTAAERLLARLSEKSA